MVIPVVPMSVQHGARARLVGGKIHYYNDAKKKSYFDSIANEVSHMRPAEPLEGPLAVSYQFYLPRPKRLTGKLSPEDAIPFDQKPDFDNLAKGLGDALGKSGFWVDDKQIWAGFVFCLYRELALQPRIEVTIHYEKDRQKTG